MSAPVVHASVELLEAMRGAAPYCSSNPVLSDYLAPACGAVLQEQEAPVAVCDYFAVEDTDDGPVTCPACIALYPPEIRMRMDYVLISRGAA